jgi:LAO/AO transport system kinase
VLTDLLPQRKPSLRVGVSGVPGAGKSTFIENLGSRLTAAGHRVAVLAIDPSSSVTGGSILGDKTRMEKLAADANAFIRPSPSGGALGGVARKTRESIVLFEAAGYDVILVETMGVGQSEIQVRSMVDVFLLFALAGAGDELQGIKKGVAEIADVVIVNKADGQGITAAELTRVEAERALHYLQPATKGWVTQALACSALTGEGVAQVWEVVEDFARVTRASAVFEERRRNQETSWMRELVNEGLATEFSQHPGVAALRKELEAQVAAGEIPAAAAAERLLELFLG